MIDLSPHDLELVKRVLRDHVPGCEVRAFGSRAKWTAKDYSDLDLAVIGESEIESATLAQLKEAFEDSTLPMRVDVLDWHDISAEFREVIKRESVELRTGSSWEQTTLGACVSLVRDSVTPAACGDAAYVGLEHIGQGTLALLRTGTAKDVESTKTAFRAGDILFGKLRPYFRKVVHPRFDGICSTDIWVLRPKGDVDAGYIFYLLASSEFVNFASQCAEGTRMPRAKWEQASRFTLRIPSLAEQRTVAKILGALDDRIELNRRMAATLEETVRSLFKSWFLDRPVQELSGWRSWRLKEIATHSKVSVSPYREPERTYEHYSIPAYDAGRQPVVGSGLAIKSNKTVIPKNAVLVSKLNPSKPRVWVPDCHGVLPKIASTEFLVFVPKMGFGRGLLWAIFTSRAFQQGVQGLATGTSGSHQRASPSEVANLECIVGDADVFATFESIVGPLVDEQVLMTTESRALADLRDTLLPKLVSGEIRIQDAEKIVEAKT